MRTFKRFLMEVGVAAPVAAFFFLAAYACRTAPWPRSIAVPLEFTLQACGVLAAVDRLAARLLRPGGWAEETMRLPSDMTRQLNRAILIVVLAAAVFLIPEQLLHRGLIAPDGRPVPASRLTRLFSIAFEISAAVVAIGLARRRSPLLAWLARVPSVWALPGKNQRATMLLAIVGSATIIVLDVRGYCFTARRLSFAVLQSSAIVLGCALIHWIIIRTIDKHSWRWVRKKSGYGDAAEVEELNRPEELAAKLRGLTGVIVPLIGLALAASVWDLDLALFHTLGGIRVWPVGGEVWVTVADLFQGVVIAVVSAGILRYMSTFFAVVIFPRMRDDPGVQFAALTLCRYAVLCLGTLSALSSIRLGFEKIGVVVAALGVGLGFGLQEIVSNFICGLILLLERPIRVGDVVTVAGMTGKIDRINIRATTLINADNHSLIVPNKEFVTGSLTNWTHKDKVVRVLLNVGAAYGVDPDRVSGILLDLAAADPDVLKNPAPSSFLESLGDSALNFSLCVHVPDPGLASRVRHRLYGAIQRGLDEAGVAIPYPTHELLIKSVPEDLIIAEPARRSGARVDPGDQGVPAPRYARALRDPADGGDPPRRVELEHNMNIDE